MTLAQKNKRNEIQAGQKYILKSKIQSYTDPELKAIGYGKNPEFESEDVTYYRYDDMSRAYDLGLSEDSRDFSTMSEKDIAEALKDREYVKKCLLHTYGQNALKSLTEAESPLSGRGLGMKHGKVFNTNNPEQVSELWGLLISKKVCFEEEQHLPQYKEAMYIVESLDELTSMQEEVDKVTEQLTEWMIPLLATDFELAVLFLKEVNATINNKMKKAALTRLVLEMIRNPKDRNALHQMYKDRDSKEEEVKLKDKVKGWVSNGILKEKNNIFYYGEVKLGNDINDVIRHLLNNDELYNELIVL